MRILQVVTLIDGQSSYGGPLTVALGQCEELARRGHEPMLLAGWRGEGQPPRTLSGIPTKLFRVRPIAPGLRYAGLISFGMHHWLSRHAGTFDVVHVHLARDLVPLTSVASARRAGIPYVVQSHGMVRPDHRRLVRLLDRLATRSALCDAAAVLSLTSREDQDLCAVAGPAISPVRVRNGIATQTDHADARPTNSPPEVLFLARIHPRKRVLDFVRAAFEVLDAGVVAKFIIAGPADGDLHALRRLLGSRADLASSIRYIGSQDRQQSQAWMSRADLYVLPSVDEPYPMTVIEALAAGTPVICTTSCGLADVINEYDAGRVVSPTASELAAAIRELVENSETRERLLKNAVKAAQEACPIHTVADELESLYTRASRSNRELRTFLRVDDAPTRGVSSQNIADGFNTVNVTASDAKPMTMIGSPEDYSHRFIYVGQFIPRKNLPSLLSAFTQMDSSDTLTLVGEGPDEQALRDLTMRLGVNDRVNFSGHLDGDDLVQAYHASHTLVLPSTIEVWGLVVNEALAAGLHVVISEACGAAPSLQQMPGVFISEPKAKELAISMRMSKTAWRGPIQDPPVLQQTPRAFAKIILDVADQAVSQKGA